MIRFYVVHKQKSNPSKETGFTDFLPISRYERRKTISRVMRKPHPGHTPTVLAALFPLNTVTHISHDSRKGVLPMCRNDGSSSSIVIYSVAAV